MKTYPVRTCLGCGKKGFKKEFRRFAVDDAGTLVMDNRSIIGGRGAYCCMNGDCMRLFMKNRKRLLRAFHVQVIEWNKQ
ncbi:MAG: YlxR family protein [Desulfobulbaceae bacterium]|nr:YlxR family protein [Desulfobulbaceae bacterium]MCK5322666.1 YlxR family protein [Desulfobulbaceae bacterium]MCK5544765.1 YlxR family protein [Desulfobulbaceae bacterium]